MLSPERRAAAGSLAVPVQDLAEGPFEVARSQRASPSHLGLLLLDGVIAREVVLGGTCSTELLVPGDIVRP